jgi:Carboxypeptidase regulatory-like domain/Cytochrome c554 and c-prime
MRRHFIAAVTSTVVGVLIGTAIWWFFPQRKQSDPVSVTGIVVDETGPLQGALVQLAGSNASTTTDADGRFRLPAAPGSTMVTAFKTGYFISVGPAGESELKLVLRKLPAADHDEYRWSPDRCVTCHNDIHDEWKSSAHGFGSGSSRFSQLFRGGDSKEKGTGWNLTHDKPEGTEVCASCHQPTAGFFAVERDPSVKATPANRIHCDFCHKIVGPAGTEIGLTHGRFGLELLRPKDGELNFGPLTDAALDENSFSPFYRQSRYCASCHEGLVFGVRVYETYSEWQASPAGKTGTQCQECHMRPTGKMTNFAPGHGGVGRDPHTIANHTFFDGSHREMLQRCLSLDLQLATDPNAVRALVEIKADKVGHRVPTGLPDRNLVLVVEAFDAGGKPLQLTAGPALPALAGPDVHLKAGKLFAKVLKDWEGHAPAPFWRAMPEFEDTRLRPGQTEHVSFSFPAEAVTFKARLIYRKFWPEVTKQKGWPDDAWVVAEKHESVQK